MKPLMIRIPLSAASWVAVICQATVALVVLTDPVLASVQAVSLVWVSVALELVSETFALGPPRRSCSGGEVYGAERGEPCESHSDRYDSDSSERFHW